MRKTLLLLSFVALPGLAQAVDCSSAGPQRAAPLRPTVLSPISSELATPSYQLGGAGSVLAQAYDESQSVDQVLLRLRIEGCANIAKAMPAPSAVNPNDPAAYKPQTAFDNTPWRFDMSQNGKRMTADEFDAWMKARGVRVVKVKPAAPVTVPAATSGVADAAAPGTAVPAAPAPPSPATPAAPLPTAAPEPVKR